MLTNTRTMLKYATRKAIKYFIFKCARLQVKVVKNVHQIALLKLCLMPCEYWLFAFEIVQECKVCLCEQTYKYICLIKQKKTDSNLAFESVLIGWDGWVRTIEMPESKSGALPLGYIPICSNILTHLCVVVKNYFI